METITPDHRALATARRQHGALAHRQARAAGLSDEQIDARVRNRLWVRRLRGVYVVAGSPDSAWQRAVVAFLATERAGGVLSHLTAAAIDGIGAFPTLPHVTVSPGASVRCRGARVHRGHVPLIDRAHRDGVLATSTSRTLVDLATVLDRPRLEEAVDVAFCRRTASSGSVLAALERAGRRRRGAELIRSVVGVWSEAIEPGSVAEVRLLRQLDELGLIGFVTQHEVVDATGAFVARLDLAHPGRRCAFEYDGVETHGVRAWTRDEPRYARLRALGWDVRSITKLDLLPGERRLRQLADRWTDRCA